MTIVPAIDEHPAAARLAALGLPHVLDAGAIAAPLIVVGLETCADAGRHTFQCRPFCRRHRSQSGTRRVPALGAGAAEAERR